MSQKATIPGNWVAHAATFMMLCVSATPVRAGEDCAPECLSLPEALATLIPVSSQEVRKIKNDLVEWFTLTRNSVCTRPVLRGEPVPGDAGPGIAELFSMVPRDFVACSEFVDANTDRLNDCLLGKTVEPQMEKEGARLCAKLVTSMIALTRHEGGCGPILPERTEFPGPYVLMLRFFKAGAIWLRSTPVGKGEADPLQVGTDLLRLAQDVTRGPHGGIIRAMLSVAAFRMVAEFGIRPVLNRPEKLSVTQLDELVRDIGILIDTEPSLGEILAAEYRLFLVETWLPCVLGNRSRLHPTLQKVAQASLSGGIFEEESDQLMQWICRRSLSGAVIAARGAQRGCPTETHGVSCLEGLGREQNRAQRRKSPAFVLVATLLRGRPLTTFRNLMLAGSSPIIQPKYLAKWSQRIFALGALRLHAAIRKHYAERGKCPTLEALSGPKWASMNRDINTGEPFVMTAPGKNRLMLSSTDFVGEVYEGEFETIAYVIHCPPGSKEEVSQ